MVAVFGIVGYEAIRRRNSRGDGIRWRAEAAQSAMDILYAA